MLNTDSPSVETLTCAMCGAASGNAWQTEPARERKLRLEPRSGDPEHSWTLCDECSEGLQGLALAKPDPIHLLAHVRRANIADQRAVLDWLLQKFKLQASPKE